jgi:hypothetical protein
VNLSLTAAYVSFLIVSDEKRFQDEFIQSLEEHGKPRVALIDEHDPLLLNDLSASGRLFALLRQHFIMWTDGQPLDKQDLVERREDVHAHHDDHLTQTYQMPAEKCLLGL